jgi:U3 small nucleolar RNA-associated protein 14
MANEEKKEKKEIADEILRTVDKIIPGFGSFFKKGEKTKKFGSQMKKIREEINKRFGSLEK